MNSTHYLRQLGRVCFLLLIGSSPISAQIVPDATLPNNTIAIPNGNTIRIEGGTTAGSNLFHSFREFSVPTGGEAFFNNALDIQNIFSRVTGGKISNIDGLIRANGGANLFLINPNGIIFGPNAQLNIGGSFIGSTANSIRFADGSEFSATNPQTSPLLTVNVPIGLQFGPNPGNIVVQGVGNNLFISLDYEPIREERPAGLQVPSGQTLALIGGDISLIGGNLTAEEGRIEMGSVSSGSYVTLTPASGWQLGYQGVENFQDISLSQEASVDVSGSGGGNIQVQARRLTLTEGSAILSLTEGSKAGGNLTVRATESVELIGATTDPLFFSGLVTTVQPGATGKGGNITIETRQLRAGDGGQVQINTFGPGDGGSLTVKATDSIELFGVTPNNVFASGLFASAISPTSQTGNVGNITVETGRLTIRDGARIDTATFSSGKGGNMTVKADLIEALGTGGTGEAIYAYPSGLQALTDGTGDAGNITVETRRLVLVDGAILTTETFREGNAGTLTIRATDSVELIGETPDANLGSGLRNVTFGGGNGGNVIVETGRLIVRDGAEVNVSTFGAGKGGKIAIRADSVELSGISKDGVFGSGLYARARQGSTGDAGDLKIATGELIIRDRAIATVRSEATGIAGNLEVKANSIRLDDGGSLNAQTKSPSTENQANITLNSQNIQLRRGGSITTDAQLTATGGNITIDTNTLVALENSDITANAQEGAGGRVTINAQGIFGTQFREQQTDLSDITATSDLGADFSGTVTINTPDVNQAAGLVELPENFTDPTNSIAQGCPADRGDRFVVTGRGGLPDDPSQTLRGQAVWRDLRPVAQRGSGGAGEPRSRGAGEREFPSPQSPGFDVRLRREASTVSAQPNRAQPNRAQPNVTNHQSPIVEATGWAIDSNGQVQLVAKSLNGTPPRPWYRQVGCGDF